MSFNQTLQSYSVTDERWKSQNTFLSILELRKKNQKTRPQMHTYIYLHMLCMCNYGTSQTKEDKEQQFCTSARLWDWKLQNSVAKCFLRRRRTLCEECTIQIIGRVFPEYNFWKPKCRFKWDFKNLSKHFLDCWRSKLTDVAKAKQCIPVPFKICKSFWNGCL